ncbi:HAD-IA family hydrolase [Alsobacter sp. SYSU BS001988]
MRAYLFDMDGTLVDSASTILASHASAFEALGMEPPAPATLLALVGVSLIPTYEALVGPDGPVEDLVARYREAFRSRVSAPGHRERLFPGADAVLRRLAARPGTALGLVTGKSRRGVARILEAEGWGPLFATVQTADDAPSKPHPAMALQALAAIGAEPGDAVVIGDTTFDVEMARAAGLRAIGVDWGHHGPDLLRAAGAERVISSFDELDP